MKGATFLIAWLALLLACQPENGIIGTALAQQGPDMVILRDGSQRTGALRSCDGKVCMVGTSPVNQASIAWIGLGRKPPAPQVRNATRHEIHLVNKNVATAASMTLDATHVQADENRYPRAQVAWIHIPGPAPVLKGAWKGKMEYTGSGERFTFTGYWNVAVASDATGRLKGSLTGEETHNGRAGTCLITIVQKLTYEAVLVGKVSREHGGLALDIESETSVPGQQRIEPPCKVLQHQWGGPNPYILYEPAVRQMLANVRPAADGSLQSGAEWRMPANPEYLYKAKITLRPAEK